MEIISHTWNHYDFKNAGDVEEKIYNKEITASIKYLEKLNKSKQICFVCPNNYADDKIYEKLKENEIVALRRWKRGENSLSPQNGVNPGEWLNLKTRGIGDVDSTAGRNAWIDSVIDNKNWLIEMWHNVEFPGYQSISYEDADAHLNYVFTKTNFLWVAGFEEATKYIIEKQNLTLHCKAFFYRIFIWGELPVQYPIDTYNEEITVKIKSNEKSNTVLKNGVNMNVRHITEYGEWYILFEMCPTDIIVIK